ncbi:hypothetical protein [Zobellella maritima]|uniref:hypothetical protein n=1 Tax=Zobellella maritima TaxID=2059725 RepID=UPI000E301A82|nr:hypothetical protein [Zobellella maritima]
MTKLTPLLLCTLLAACAGQDTTDTDSKASATPQEGTTASAQQSTQQPVPKGEYTQIDVKRSQAVMDQIAEGNTESINTVLQQPNDYAPPVLYLVSAIMFDSDYQDQAVFWFYTAQLRARSDANKAQDKTTHDAINQLNRQFGRRIIPYATSNPDRLAAIVNQSLEWDSKQSRNYDPRWIALTGKDMLTETRVNFAPKEKWAEIDALTRSQYRQGLEQALAEMRQPAEQ